MNHQGNAAQKHNEVSFYPTHDSYYQKERISQLGRKMLLISVGSKQYVCSPSPPKKLEQLPSNPNTGSNTQRN